MPGARFNSAACCPPGPLRLVPHSTPAAAALSSAAVMTAPLLLRSRRPASSKATPSSASSRRFFCTLAQAAPQLPLKPPRFREAAITRWQGTAGANGLRLSACSGEGGTAEET